MTFEELLHLLFLPSGPVRPTPEQDDATARSIIACRATNNWPLPGAAPGKETCDISDIRWDCTRRAVPYAARMPTA